MALMLVLGAVALTPVPVKAEAPPLRQWVQTYGFAGYDSQAISMAVDSSGNVYVTGYSDNGTGSGADYATIKYSPAGVQLWATRYNGPANSLDEANAIALDSNGNAYVTGRSIGTNTGEDYATLKYKSSDGTIMWPGDGAARYTGPGGYDSAHAIAVDSSGNAYVTGTSNNGTSYDYATLKYKSSDGTIMWSGPTITDGAARYNGPGNGEDQPLAMALDSSGNAYVTGFSRGSGLYDDYATLKYNSSDGTTMWSGPTITDGAARYNGPGNGDDWALAIALDSSGNAYVTGDCFGIDTGEDYATLKYKSSDGTIMWPGDGAARYNGPGNGNDAAFAIALDSSGNAYVTGWSYGSGNWDYATLKYNSSDGAIMWTGLPLGAARYNGTANLDDYANAIALDSSGNAYVTGDTNYPQNSGIATLKETSGIVTLDSSEPSGMATLKYGSSDGSQAWVATYGGEFGNDEAIAIAVDGGGNVYITGDMSPSADRDDMYNTIKYVQQNAAPTITAVTPASGMWGQCPLTVVITGTNLTGAAAVSFGEGITVSNIVVNSATSITANICIAVGTAPGARNVSVTTPGGTATLTGAFTVLPLLPPTGAGSGSSSSAGAGAPAQSVVLPTLAVQSATLSAITVTPGTPVTVTADIANKSTVNGIKKVTLYVNGQVETTQGVAVNSGSSSKLTFNVARSEPGDYTVYVDGVPAGSFKVELFRESDGILIFSAVLVALAFILGMVMLWRRQQRAG
jgi:hypothetical protein